MTGAGARDKALAGPAGTRGTTARPAGAGGAGCIRPGGVGRGRTWERRGRSHPMRCPRWGFRRGSHPWRPRTWEPGGRSHRDGFRRAANRNRRAHRRRIDARWPGWPWRRRPLVSFPSRCSLVPLIGTLIDRGRDGRRLGGQFGNRGFPPARRTSLEDRDSLTIPDPTTRRRYYHVVVREKQARRSGNEPPEYPGCPFTPTGTGRGRPQPRTAGLQATQTQPGAAMPQATQAQPRAAGPQTTQTPQTQPSTAVPPMGLITIQVAYFVESGQSCWPIGRVLFRQFNIRRRLRRCS